jgi:hypothetical protein
VGANGGGPTRPEDPDLLSVEELARLQGVRPIESMADMVRDAFSSDKELEEFLAHVAASRRAKMA